MVDIHLVYVRFLFLFFSFERKYFDGANDDECQHNLNGNQKDQLRVIESRLQYNFYLNARDALITHTHPAATLIIRLMFKSTTIFLSFYSDFLFVFYCARLSVSMLITTNETPKHFLFPIAALLYLSISSIPARLTYVFFFFQFQDPSHALNWDRKRNHDERIIIISVADCRQKNNLKTINI